MTVKTKRHNWTLEIDLSEGGPGSGNFGHGGVKGQLGGSTPGGGHGAIGVAAGASKSEIEAKVAARRAEVEAEKGQRDKQPIAVSGTASASTKAATVQIIEEMPDWARREVKTVDISAEHGDMIRLASGEEFELGAGMDRDGNMIVRSADVRLNYDSNGYKDGVIHEVGHAAYNGLIRDATLEAKAARAKAQAMGWTQATHSAEIDREMPLFRAQADFYQAHESPGGNGVTAYSKAWGKQSETFAEMFAIHHTQGLSVLRDITGDTKAHGDLLSAYERIIGIRAGGK